MKNITKSTKIILCDIYESNIKNEIKLNYVKKLKFISGVGERKNMKKKEK